MKFFTTKFASLKYLRVFVLGATSIFSIYAAVGYVNIDNNVDNAIQVIKKIVLTTDGTDSGTTGIVLNGTNGDSYFSGNMTLAKLPSVVVLGTNSGGVVIASTAGNVFDYIKSYLTTPFVYNLLSGSFVRRGDVSNDVAGGDLTGTIMNQHAVSGFVWNIFKTMPSFWYAVS